MITATFTPSTHGPFQLVTMVKGKTVNISPVEIQFQPYFKILDFPRSKFSPKFLFSVFILFFVRKANKKNRKMKKKKPKKRNRKKETKRRGQWLKQDCEHVTCRDSRSILF